MYFGAFIRALDDNSLLTSVSSVKENDNSSVFDAADKGINETVCGVRSDYNFAIFLRLDKSLL